MHLIDRTDLFKITNVVLGGEVIVTIVLLHFCSTVLLHYCTTALT
jgi:hypothetical protein